MTSQQNESDPVDYDGGLTARQAAQRLTRFGPNRLPEPPRRSPLMRFLGQFHNVLIYILLLAAVLAGLLDHPVDALVILAVVLVNALIGFIQEGKAEQAMAAIGKMLAVKARVRRDGRWQSIPAEELVPGDLVRVNAGDRVPADIRLLEANDLQCDEAALTGESLPVRKHPEDLPDDTPLAERHHRLHSGSMATRGTGVGLVEQTGGKTELGKISHLLEAVETLTTPLLRQVNRFGRTLTVVILMLAILMLIVSLNVHGMVVGSAFLAAIALVVAAIPEGLPAIITITLAIGVRRMSSRQAIIRRLPAVETLGSVTVICSDKTGTLTRNELSVRQVVLAEGNTMEGSAASRELVDIAVLCNDAEPDGAGDPIEHALLELAEQAGVDPGARRADAPRTALLPFSSERKLMASGHGQRLFVKGAPERILALASREFGPQGPRPLAADYWERHLEAMTGSGLRVLALAESADARQNHNLDESQLDSLVMVALVGFADPPRDEVPEAIAACHDAGIDVRMITGDHAATAAAIARELGIADSGTAVFNGPELDRLSDRELRERVSDIRVVARATPEHKLRLVEALQVTGQVVAMTGDGANDAPALKRADIGVAMGIKGTEAARQAGEMVLADDHFATLVAGVEEGRGVYDNIRKAILFILPTNAAEALTILVAVAAGLTLPITPVQILWINMITAVTLALALAFEPLEGDVMTRPPRRPGSRLLDSFMVFRILWVGLLLAGGVFWLHQFTLDASGDPALASTVALNLLVMGELVYLFSCRHWQGFALAAKTLFTNPWVWRMALLLMVLQLCITYLPPAQAVFGTVSLPLAAWGPILALAVALFIVVELEKWLTRRLGLNWARPGH